MTKGDIVNNGYATFQVEAISGSWAWVFPIGIRCPKDGPLTHKVKDLSSGYIKNEDGEVL